MLEEIFSKILNQTATDAEKSDFYRSLEEDSERCDLFLQYKNIYAVSNCKPELRNQVLSDRFERFWRRIQPVKQHQLLNLWVRYAAVVVVTLSLSFFFQYLVFTDKSDATFIQKIEYTSERGSVSTIHLEDGSAIWLSSGSKIVLNKNAEGEMSAQLNGEAYFDMVPDPKRKFTVDLGYFKVKDIGTKFNIKAYPDETVVCAALVDGQIDLYKCGAEPILSMKPGEYLQFDKQSNHMAISIQDPAIATAWKDGKFVFIDKTLEEICRELGNWYNLQIIIKNKSLANTKYTSVIKRTTTVKLVLEMLSLTDKINYTITDRKEASDIVYIY